MPEEESGDEISKSSLRSEIPLPEPRWPAIATFVTAWCCPATSARRTRHVSLWSAWAIHFVAAVLTFVLITILASLGDNRHALFYLLEIGEEFTGSDWQEATIALGASVIGIEIAFLLLALIVAPCGAGEERLRSSWAHALRITWLHTTHTLPTVLLVGGLAVLYCWDESIYRQTHDYSGIPSDNGIGDSYKHLVVKYGSIVITWIGVGCFCWILGALYRAVGQGRGVPPKPRDPMCEFCGYNLSVTPMDSRCPECGELVMDSLGPDVRPGTAWDRAQRGNRLRAWWRCGVDAIVRPSQLGRQIQTHSRPHRYRMFLTTHLAIIFMFAGMGIVACFLYDMYPHMKTQSIAEPLLILPAVIGSTTMLGSLVIAGLATFFVGTIYSLRNGRNLLGASMQMACYLGLYLTIWTAFCNLLGFAAFVMVDKGVLRPFAQALHMQHEPLGFFLWLMPNPVFLVGYLVLLWRGTAAAQHANR